MRTVLIIIPYDPIYPPLNGGMQRCFHILHQLAKHFAVTAVINQDRNEFENCFQLFPAMSSVEIYSTKDQKQPTDLFSVFPGRVRNGLRYRWYKKKIRGTTDSNFLKYYPLLKKLLTKKKFDVVILENLDTLNAVDIIRGYAKNVPIFYDAHNVDSLLAAEKKMSPSEQQGLIAAESNLYKSVTGVLTCSMQDLETLRQLNNEYLEGVVIPNGVHLETRLSDAGVNEEEARYILFCGSLSYEPNTEGLHWFHENTWPKLRERFPNLKLIVVGSGKLPANMAHLYEDDSLVITGTVADVQPWYNKAGIAIVPLLTGGGTRLKILEAMGFGIPVVSTAKGAEGIGYTDGADIIIADNGYQFFERITELLVQKEKRIQVQQKARLLVEKKYDWNIIGSSLATFLTCILNSPHSLTAGKN